MVGGRVGGWISVLAVSPSFLLPNPPTHPPTYLGLRLDGLGFPIHNNAQQSHHVGEESIGEDIGVLLFWVGGWVVE